MASPISNIITKESFQGTIARDEASCYWFARAILRPQLDGRFPLSDPDAPSRPKLKRIILLQQAIFFISIPTLLVTFLNSRQTILFWLTVAATLILYLLERIKIHLVSDMAWHWINKEFSPEELGSITYFQLTERLGRKYEIPTLVDIITRWDWVIRKWLLGSYVIASLILFLNLIHFLVILFIVFCVVSLALRYASPR